MEMTMPRLREPYFVSSALAVARATGLAQRKRIDRFTFEYDITATIEAATQAEAEAKLLAEPTLLDFTDFGDFDVSFRAGGSDTYIRIHSDDSHGCAPVALAGASAERRNKRRDTESWEPLSVIHVILTDKRA